MKALNIDCRCLLGFICFLTLLAGGARGQAFSPHQHYLEKTAQTIRSSVGKHGGFNRPEQDLVNELLGSYRRSSFLEDTREQAGTLLEQGLGAVSNTSYDVSPTCLNDTEIFLEALFNGEQWALKMVDAAGKPPSDVLGLNLLWLGSYDECLSVEGQYCTATFLLSTQPSLSSPQGTGLTIGLCTPRSCSDSDVTALVKTAIFILPVNTSSLPYMLTSCKPESRDLDTKAIVATVICSVFLFIMIVATAYDLLVVQYQVFDLISGANKYKLLADVEEADQHSSSGDETVNQSEKTPLKERKYPGYNGNAVGASLGPDGPVQQSTTSKHPAYKPGRAGQLLLAFSVYTNGKKLLNTSQPSGTLSAVNGIRFLSMSWVILGHTYAFVLSLGDNTAEFFPKMMKRFSFQAIANATVAVDSFFLLSGLLLAYLALKQLKKSEGAARFGWGMYYFHRFWRLTPPYMLTLMIYACLFKYFTNGPVWPLTMGDECEDTWWKNLLYINNFFDMNEMCFGWSWYLSNDMQFFILSPLLLVPLYYSTLLGVGVCLLFLLACFISAGVISSSEGLTANLLLDPTGEIMNDMYVKPYTRIGPYVVGILTGYLLYVTDCKVKIPKILNLIGWAVATGTALAVLYGLYEVDGDNFVNHLSNGVNALYNSVSRSAWGAALAWVVFACATGHGGFVNTLLSWSPFVPLGRLTYCAYLVHPIIMYLVYFGRQTLIHLTDLELIYLFFGHMLASYLAAFVVSLAFESPMMGLEKALLGRGKNS